MFVLYLSNFLERSMTTVPFHMFTSRKGLTLIHSFFSGIILYSRKATFARQTTDCISSFWEWFKTHIILKYTKHFLKSLKIVDEVKFPVQLRKKK